MEGPLHAVACLECAPNRCSCADFCMSLPRMERIEEVVTDYLRGVPLRQLIDQAVPLPENIRDFTSGVQSCTFGVQTTAHPPAGGGFCCISRRGDAGKVNECILKPSLREQSGRGALQCAEP